MRTTVTFDADVASAVDDVRKDRQIGVSEAVNELIRRGLTATHRRSPFRQYTAPMGLSLDVANVADAIEVLDGPHGR